MYLDARFICISQNNKNCWFLLKKMLMSAKLKESITWFIHFLCLLLVRSTCAKFHLCRICVTDLREIAFLTSPCLGAAIKKPVLTRVNIFYCFFTVVSKRNTTCNKNHELSNWVMHLSKSVFWGAQSMLNIKLLATISLKFPIKFSEGC